MNAQDDAGAMDVSKETEPEKEATEQETTESEFQDTLLKLAEEEGHAIGDKPPEDKPESISAEPEETEEEVPEEAEGVPEGTDSETEEEEKPEEELKPAAKKGDEWPTSAKVRVAEETAKRKRANERADKAEAAALALQAQLQKVVAPQPTEDNPFLDINDPSALERLERSYEKAIDLADENPDGAVDVVVGIENGQEKRRDFTPEELTVMRRKAEKAVRKFIPERRTYLQQRAQADAAAVELYPELKDVDSEFTQVAAIAAQKIFSGQALKEPEILIALGDYARGYLSRIKEKSSPSVKTPEAKRILESAKQKIAPTPVRSRSVPERKSSVSLEKADQKVKKEGTREAAEEYLDALWSKKGGSSKRVETVSE